mmetsp:Transcript_7356/g.27043  ORF Transcript_7356/g.27043 Transcript_7356/m.27043 type:complete len:341 (+) Transcript_7356:232-1254(+)
MTKKKTDKGANAPMEKLICKNPNCTRSLRLLCPFHMCKKCCNRKNKDKCPKHFFPGPVGPAAPATGSVLSTFDNHKRVRADPRWLEALSAAQGAYHGRMQVADANFQVDIPGYSSRFAESKRLRAAREIANVYQREMGSTAAWRVVAMRRGLEAEKEERVAAVQRFLQNESMMRELFTGPVGQGVEDGLDGVLESRASESLDTCRQRHREEKEAYSQKFATAEAGMKRAKQVETIRDLKGYVTESVGAGKDPQGVVANLADVFQVGDYWNTLRAKQLESEVPDSTNPSTPKEALVDPKEKTAMLDALWDALKGRVYEVKAVPQPSKELLASFENCECAQL